MKKKVLSILLTMFIVCGICGCSSSDSSSATEEKTLDITQEQNYEENNETSPDASSETEEDYEETTEASSDKKLSDVDFIVNLGKGLEARWDLTNSSKYDSDALNQMSLSDFQAAYSLFVNAEYDAIGDLDDYEFENQDLQELAEKYMKGLDLQKEGVQYQGTSEYTLYDETWTLGYNYRAVVIAELYNNYGLTVDKKYQSELDDFIAVSASAKKSVDIQEFVDRMGDIIDYEIDAEKSDEYTTYYTAVIENTTDYDIDSLDIEVDFLDSSGVIVYQTFDYISNFMSGSKVQSSIYYYTNNGNFATMQITLTAYIY